MALDFILRVQEAQWLVRVISCCYAWAIADGVRHIESDLGYVRARKGLTCANKYSTMTGDAGGSLPTPERSAPAAAQASTL